MGAVNKKTAAMDASGKDLEYIRNFRLLDDDYMTKFFEENVECTEFMLRIILEDQGLKVHSVHTQHEIRNLQGHSVKLDIYATDSRGRKINCEVQRSDKGGVPKRARYHSSVIDANILSRGEDYGSMAETYVIFITETDELGAGLPIYHIDRVVQETGLCFGDGSHIIYVNNKCRDETPLGILMHDFACSDPGDMRYKLLADRARYLKESKEGIKSMCRAMEEMRNETRLEQKKRSALKMLMAGKLSYEEIADYQELSLDQVEELANELSRLATV